MPGAMGTSPLHPEANVWKMEIEPGSAANNMTRAKVELSNVKISLSDFSIATSPCSSPKLGEDQSRTFLNGEAVQSKPKPWLRRIATVFPIAMDMLCVVVPALVILLLHLVGEPYHRGFSCEDLSIRFVYADSTVSTLNMIAVSVGVNLLGVVLNEAVLRGASSRQRRCADHSADIGRDRIGLRRIFRVLALFAMGSLWTTTITDTIKYMLGVQRPHFIDVCKPDWAQINCSAGIVFDAHCTGQSNFRLTDARLSFPSGHSSNAVFSAVFFSVYLQYRLKVRRSLLLVKFLQLVVLALALLCGLSRISDHKHHWSDVLAGAVLGAAMAIWFTGPIRSKKLDESHDEATTAAGV